MKKILIIVMISFAFWVKADELNEKPLPYSETTVGRQFIEEFYQYLGYQKSDLYYLFDQVQKNERVIKLMSRPAEKTKPWHAYKKIFLDKKRVNNGVLFYKRHQKTLYEAYLKYGIPPEVVVAIIGVETRYGKVMGKHRVLSAISTLAFDYPKRSPFFTQELKSFLIMAKQEGFHPLSPKGSYAGAMGMAQFMPSSFLNYAVDYEHDGKIDLWKNPRDAIFSIANYLYQHGWKSGAPIVISAKSLNIDLSHIKSQHKPYTSITQLVKKGILSGKNIKNHNQKVGLLKLKEKDGERLFKTFNNFFVITTYNTSPLYAMAVFKLSQQIKNEHQKSQ